MPDEPYDYDPRDNGTSDDYHADNTPERASRHRGRENDSQTPYVGVHRRG